MSNEAKTLDLFASSGEYSASEEAIFRSAANGIRAQQATIDGLVEALRRIGSMARQAEVYHNRLGASETFAKIDAAVSAAIGGGLEGDLGTASSKSSPVAKDANLERLCP